MKAFLGLIFGAVLGFISVPMLIGFAGKDVGLLDVVFSLVFMCIGAIVGTIIGATSSIKDKQLRNNTPQKRWTD